MLEKGETGSILKKNTKWLLEEYYEGNQTLMERETGVNRTVINEILNGRKENISSSTLLKFFRAGVNLNWLLDDLNQPFWIDKDKNSSMELSKKKKLDNKTIELKQTLSDVQELLDENPDLSLDASELKGFLQLISRSL